MAAVRRCLVEGLGVIALTLVFLSSRLEVLLLVGIRKRFRCRTLLPTMGLHTHASKSDDQIAIFVFRIIFSALTTTPGDSLI